MDLYIERALIKEDMKQAKATHNPALYNDLVIELKQVNKEIKRQCAL